MITIRCKGCSHVFVSVKYILRFMSYVRLLSNDQDENEEEKEKEPTKNIVCR